MGFGLFKKLKDGFKKATKWLKEKVINPTIDIMKKTKPILEKIDLKPINPRLDEIKDKALEFSDDVINVDDRLKNKDYNGVIEYAGRKFIPRLKYQ